MAARHKYRNLKIGAVERYSMIAKLEHIDYWRRLGWLDFAEIGLPKGEEKAYLTYGEIKAGETLMFNRPDMLKDASPDRLIGRKIVGVSACLGTYGMGGAGFVGLKLDSGEYLVYAVWNAIAFTRINDQAIAHNDELTDNAKSPIAQSVIYGYEINKNDCLILLRQGEQNLSVRFTNNTSNGKQKAYKKGEISDYLLFQYENARLIV